MISSGMSWYAGMLLRVQSLSNGLGNLPRSHLFGIFQVPRSVMPSNQQIPPVEFFHGKGWKKATTPSVYCRISMEKNIWRSVSFVVVFLGSMCITKSEFQSDYMTMLETSSPHIYSGRLGRSGFMVDLHHVTIELLMSSLYPYDIPCLVYQDPNPRFKK